MTPTDIIREVEQALSLPSGAVIGTRKLYAHTEGRFMAAWLMRKGLGMTLIDVAGALGRSGHKSAMNAIDNATHRIKTEPAFYMQAQHIMQMIAAEDNEQKPKEKKRKTRR